MKNCFSAFVLLSCITAITGCQNVEPVNPEAGRQVAGGYWDFVVFNQVGADTITKGIYLGLAIGEQASDSYTVLQNLWQQKKINQMYTISVEVPDFSQLERSLPLYSTLFLRYGEGTHPGVDFTFEKGKVKTIHHYDAESSWPAQWPAAELASSAIAVGDPAATVYKKLSLLKAKTPYASYFNYMLLSGKDFSQGYDPALASLSEWSFGVPTGANKVDNIQLNFRQGTLSSIYVRHYIY